MLKKKKDGEVLYQGKRNITSTICKIYGYHVQNLKQNYFNYRFPNRPDLLVPYEYLSHRMAALEEYLDTLLQIEIYKRHPETVSYFYFFFFFNLWKLFINLV